MFHTNLHKSVRELLVLIVFILVLDLFVLPRLLSNWVHSRYFDDNDDLLMEKVLQNHNKREEKADLYIIKMDQTSSTLDQTMMSSNVDILVAVMTVNRVQRSFLKQVLTSVDQQVKSVNKQLNKTAAQLVVCNVNFIPEEHQSLNQLKDYFQIENVRLKDRTHHCCVPDNCHPNTKQKTIGDYAECLKMAHNKYKFKHLLLLEDDASPWPHSIAQILHLSNNLMPNYNDRWLLTKLYSSVAFQGFEQTMGSILELVTISGLISAPIYLNYYKAKFLSRSSSTIISKGIALAVIFATVICLFLALGRQHTVLAIKRMVIPYQIHTGLPVGTVAVLYPRDRLSTIINVMDTQMKCNGHEIDIQLNALMHRLYQNDQCLWVEGPLIEHLGFSTSVVYKNKSQHTLLKQFVGQYIYFPPKS